MQKFRFKSILASTVAIIFAFTVNTVGVFAKNEDENVLSPRNLIISTARNDFYINSDGALQCYGYTKVPSGYDAKMIVELQQRAGGWDTIKTWSGTNESSVTINEAYYAYNGYEYRLKITHQALKAGIAVESIVQYSNVLNY